MIRKLILLTLLSLAPGLHAAPEADPSAKLREQLKAALLQLRTAQTETANLQATQAATQAKLTQLEEKSAALEKSKALLEKKSAEQQSADQATITRLNEQVAARDQAIAQYKDALAKWKDGYEKAAALAREKEDQRATLASEAIVLKRTIADRESKNIALFQTSIEILDRFENYALGKALSAREPFIRTTRVQVENLVQGYKDRIIDQRISAPKP